MKRRFLWAVLPSAGIYTTLYFETPDNTVQALCVMGFALTSLSAFMMVPFKEKTKA